MKDFITNPKRILVVEDESVIRELCLRVLTGEGYKVEVAADGKVAKAMIGKRRYDLYLFDIKMPALDGKELYGWLQEAYPGSIGRVVFNTGSVVGKDTQSFLQNSGRPVLVKPFTLEELKATIRQALEVADK